MRIPLRLALMRILESKNVSAITPAAVIAWSKRRRRRNAGAMSKIKKLTYSMAATGRATAVTIEWTLSGTVTMARIREHCIHKNAVYPDLI